MSDVLIPVYYLRGAVNVLLQHAKAKVRDSKNEENPSFDESYISETHNQSNFQPEEEDFIRKHSIKLYKTYKIQSNKVQIVWLSIHRYWASNRDKPILSIKKLENTEKYSILTSATEVYKQTFKEANEKSTLQTMLYAELKKWDTDKPSKAPRITTRFALAVINLAICAAYDVNDEAEFRQLVFIKESIETKLKFVESNSQEHNQLVNNHIQYWKTGKSTGKIIPDSFLDSYWTAYERTDGLTTQPQPAQWGIALSSIYIGKPDGEGHTPITLSTKYIGRESLYKGVITVDSDSVHLVAHLIRENDLKTPAFFVMRLNYNNPESHSSVVGFFMYYSIYYSCYLTKSTVWTKCEKAIIPQDISNADSTFKNLIPQEIRSFLNNRLRNRLTMPSKYLTSLSNHEDHLHSLKQWIFERDKNIVNDNTLQALAFQEKYLVCYYHGDSQSNKTDDKSIASFLRIDELDIIYNADSSEFEVTYIHKRDALQKKEIMNQDNAEEEANEKNSVIEKMTKTLYRGVARRNGSTVQLLVNEEEDSNSDSKHVINKNAADHIVNRKADANFVYMGFCTPTVQRVAALIEFDKREYFPGIICGCNDNQNEPSSFRMAIVHRNSLYSSSDDSIFVPADHLNNPVIKRVCQYFRNHFASNSIQVQNQQSEFSDQFPSLEQLNNSGGTYDIQAKDGEYTITCIYNDKRYEQKGKNFNALLKIADEHVLMWF